jgi:drug/metabolite transporter (DMT)-like permease
MTWLAFALIAVVTWGLYGVLLHKGVGLMDDPVNGRFKAFLWVGVAYFVIAVVAPLVVLMWRGQGLGMTGGGIAWSLAAGTAGAIGAFGVLLAFAVRGSPSVVMSIVFAGAPVVNAVVAITLSRAWPGVRWQFVAGILLAGIGGCLVTMYKPGPPPQPATDAAPAHAADRDNSP